MNAERLNSPAASLVEMKIDKDFRQFSAMFSEKWKFSAYPLWRLFYPLRVWTYDCFSKLIVNFSLVLISR